MIELDEPEDLDSKIEFSDPYSGQMFDMHVSVGHMYNQYLGPFAAMLVRPRLHINDVRDMVDVPECIQFFQHRTYATALNRKRRRDLMEKSVKGSRGVQLRQLRDRRVPRPRLG